MDTMSASSYISLNLLSSDILTINSYFCLYKYYLMPCYDLRCESGADGGHMATVNNRETTGPLSLNCCFLV